MFKIRVWPGAEVRRPTFDLKFFLGSHWAHGSTFKQSLLIVGEKNFFEPPTVTVYIPLNLGLKNRGIVGEAQDILMGWQAYRGDQIHSKNSPT